MKQFPKSQQQKLQQREEQNALRQLPIPNNLIDFASNDYIGFAKNETIFYKLKVEQLQKENNELNSRLVECENDEGEENEENNGGWLSGVEKTLPTLVKSYREDPEATMGFGGSSVNMIFNSIFKSKANASSLSS